MEIMTLIHTPHTYIWVTIEMTNSHWVMYGPYTMSKVTQFKLVALGERVMSASVGEKKHEPNNPPHK